MHNILYFADSGNNRIRAINLATGIVTTVVGSGSGTSSADQAASLNSSLLTSIGIDTPYGVWVQNGLIYFAEQGADKVRVADPVAQKSQNPGAHRALDRNRRTRDPGPSRLCDHLGQFRSLPASP